MAQIEEVDWFPPLGQFGGPNQPWPLAVGVDPVGIDTHEGKDLLLVAEPMDASTVIGLGPYAPLGDPIWPESGGASGEWGWRGAPATLYVAATAGRSTDNADTPAAQYVPGKLQPFNYGETLFEGVDPTARSRPAAGAIILSDSDGELDYLLDYAWDGIAITLKRGDPASLYATWETVGRYRAAGLVYDLNEKQIFLRDLGWQLSGLLHAEFYLGTGGLEGDATLAGRWKPWALGYFFNAEPVLIKATTQIFQFSLTSATSVTAVKHGGVPLTFDADYPTFAALDAAVIPSGRYATCLAKSLVRVNVALEFGIRIDGCGDSETVFGHATPLTRAAVARRIATSRGVNRLDDLADIDGGSFTLFDQAHAAPVGWYFHEQLSKADALDIVMAGVLGWWRIRRDGRLSIGYVDRPTSGLKIAYRGEGMGIPKMTAWAPPRAGTYIGWQYNCAPQGRSELAASVSDATAAILGQVARFASSLSPAVASAYPTALVAQLAASGFRDEVDAQTEASRQQALLEVERRRFELDLSIDPHTDLIGSMLTLTDFNRLKLGAASNFLVTGMNHTGGSQTTVELWG